MLLKGISLVNKGDIINIMWHTQTVMVKLEVFFLVPICCGFFW